MAYFTPLVIAAIFAYAHCGCPNGWLQYDNSCYLDSSDTASSWSSAERECKSKGGHLTDITSQEENDFIARITFGAGKWFWMGVYHKESCDGFTYESTGQKISYANWHEDEENKVDKPDCVLMGYLGLWETTDCEEQQYFICESDSYISSSGLWSYNTNSFSYNGHSYRTIGKALSFPDAKEECESRNSYLVEINSEGENKYVHDKMHEAFYGQWRYIGGTDKEREGEFVWSTGSSVTFENWWPGEPNNKNGEDCMEMRYWGKWNDVDCYNDNRYICEMSLSTGEKEDKEDCGDSKEKIPSTTPQTEEEQTTTEYWNY